MAPWARTRIHLGMLLAAAPAATGYAGIQAFITDVTGVADSACSTLPLIICVRLAAHWAPTRIERHVLLATSQASTLHLPHGHC